MRPVGAAPKKMKFLIRKRLLISKTGEKLK